MCPLPRSNQPIYLSFSSSQLKLFPSVQEARRTSSASSGRRRLLSSSILSIGELSRLRFDAIAAVSSPMKFSAPLCSRSSSVVATVAAPLSMFDRPLLASPQSGSGEFDAAPNSGEYGLLPRTSNANFRKKGKRHC